MCLSKWVNHSPFTPTPESVELPLSGNGLPAREWILVGVVNSTQLGSPERLAELEKMKFRKAEHGMIITVKTDSGSLSYFAIFHPHSE